jgi:hypothetical protein
MAILNHLKMEPLVVDTVLAVVAEELIVQPRPQ